MNARIDPTLFSKIMSLPKAARLDLLEFAASASVGPEQLENIVKDMDPANDNPPNEKSPTG